MVKNLVLVYKMGKFGCVVFDIMNVCWNVESVFLIFWEILGKLEGRLFLFFVLDVFDIWDVGFVGSVMDIVFFLLFFDLLLFIF